jgi:hypothetical protein
MHNAHSMYFNKRGVRHGAVENRKSAPGPRGRCFSESESPWPAKPAARHRAREALPYKLLLLSPPLFFFLDFFDMVTDSCRWFAAR